MVKKNPPPTPQKTHTQINFAFCRLMIDSSSNLEMTYLELGKINIFRTNPNEISIKVLNMGIDMFLCEKGPFQNTSHFSFFQLWLRNRLMSAGLEPVFSHAEKSCIALYYRQFFTNIKIKIIKLIPVCCSGFCPLEPNKTCLSILFFNLISAESCLIYDAIKNYSFSFLSRFLTCLIWLTSINFEILSSIHFHLLNSFIEYRNYYKIGILAHTKNCHNSGIWGIDINPHWL